MAGAVGNLKHGSRGARDLAGVVVPGDLQCMVVGGDRQVHSAGGHQPAAHAPYQSPERDCGNYDNQRDADPGVRTRFDNPGADRLAAFRARIGQDFGQTFKFRFIEPELPDGRMNRELALGGKKKCRCVGLARLNDQHRVDRLLELVRKPGPVGEGRPQRARPQMRTEKSNRRFAAVPSGLAHLRKTFVLAWGQHVDRAVFRVVPDNFDLIDAQRRRIALQEDADHHAAHLDAHAFGLGNLVRDLRDQLQLQFKRIVCAVRTPADI